MRKAVAVLSWVALIAAAGTGQAHEGHQHKVMGTVVQVHVDVGKASHVEVKTPEGKTVILSCDDKTQFIKGKGAAKLQDVAAGMRVVATTVEEGKTIRAVEVQLGEMDAAAKPAPPAHQH